MKVLLVIFIIYINYVICESNKYAVKNFPKKVKPYGNGKILINSGKYEYKSKLPKGTTTRGSSRRSYTVFQVVGNSKTIQGVPDSPYFPVDQSYDHKPRVKKVLPDYAWGSGIRSKRAAEVEKPGDSKKANASDGQTTKVPTTTSKSEKGSKQKIKTTPQTTTATKDDDDKEERKPSNSSDKKQNTKSAKKSSTRSQHATQSAETEDKESERESVTKAAKSSRDDGKNKSKDVAKPQMRASELNETTTATTVQEQSKTTTQATTVTTTAEKKNETKPLRVHKKKKGKTGSKVGNRNKKHGKARPKRTHKRKTLKRGTKGHGGAAKGKNHGRTKKHPKGKPRQRAKKAKKGHRVLNSKQGSGNRTTKVTKGKAITDKKS